MNVYEKLNEARMRFQLAGVKKSGQNKFAGYTYYELADIVPTINGFAKDLKFTCVINVSNEIASLDFIDLEKPEDKITFTCPMSSASLKGAMEVQNTGAVITYLKRYLYQNCFEITENDVLDATFKENGENENIENLIQKVRAKMNGFNDAQLDYANKAIAQKNITMLKTCLK